MAPRPKWVFVEKNKGEHSPVQKPDSAPRSHQHPIFYSMSLVSVHLHKRVISIQFWATKPFLLAS